MGRRLARLLRTGLLVTMILVGVVDAAFAAEKRVALVIGNGAYQHASPLPNPPNDARAIAAALKEVGFEVVTGTDLDIDGMRASISKFEKALRGGAKVGLVYYAGHGMQVNGENYLIPVDATLESSADLQFQTVNASWLLNEVLASGDDGSRVSIIMLDACRNNPLTRSFAKRTRSTAGSGLAEIQAADGAYIAFATAPDKVAEDGQTGNSPFTSAMLRYIKQPGLEINGLMTAVRRDVYNETQKRQRPWASSALLGEFYFVPPENGPTQPTVVALKPSGETETNVIARTDTAPEPSPTPAAPITQQPSAEELRIAALQRVENALLQTTSARRNVQESLRLLGYTTAKADGRFGPATREAIQLFQAAMQLEVKGYVDKPTLTALERQVARATPAEEPKPQRTRPSSRPKVETGDAPDEAAPAPAPATPAPVVSSSTPGWTMGECVAPSGAAWAGMRILTADQCRKIGGSFSPL